MYININIINNNDNTFNNFLNIFENMTREDLNGKAYAEVEPLLGNELNVYKQRIDEIMSLDELSKEEEVLMEEAQKYDEYLDTVEYELPDSVEFDGKYSRNDIAKIIINALGKMEVEWSQTLGLYELVTLWKNKDMNKISNKAYDSTLRVLNQVRYKGYDEWKGILATNKFLASCHNAYSLDTGWNVLISEKHNVIMQRVELIQKQNNVINEQDVHSIMGD